MPDEIKSKIAIIIPTLNEEASIRLVLEDLKKNLKNFNYELVVVDGKSSDNTVQLAKQFGANVIYQKNTGYGEALYAGYFFANKELNCDILVTIDADGTYSAKDCINLIKKIQSYDADYVVGRRIVNSENMTSSHRIGNKIISWLIRKSLKINLSDTQCGLFAFRSYLIDNIDLRENGWAVNTELLTKASELGMIIDEIDVSYSSRIGQTEVRTLHAGMINLKVILRMIRDFEPLMLFGIMGIFLASIGVFVGSLLFYDYLEVGFKNKSNVAVLSTLLIITGIQIFSLGLVADMFKRRQQKKIHRSHNLYYEEDN